MTSELKVLTDTFFRKTLSFISHSNTLAVYAYAECSGQLINKRPNRQFARVQKLNARHNEDEIDGACAVFGYVCRYIFICLYSRICMCYHLTVCSTVQQVGSCKRCYYTLLVAAYYNTSLLDFLYHQPLRTKPKYHRSVPYRNVQNTS